MFWDPHSSTIRWTHIRYGADISSLSNTTRVRTCHGEQFREFEDLREQNGFTSTNLPVNLGTHRSTALQVCQFQTTWTQVAQTNLIGIYRNSVICLYITNGLGPRDAGQLTIYDICFHTSRNNYVIPRHFCYTESSYSIHS